MSEMHANHLFDLKQVSDPQISADGSLAAFVVTETNLKENKKLTNIWVKCLKTNNPIRQLTQSGKDSNPKFTADSKSIIFTSSRGEKGKPKFYKININGGEAEELLIKESPAGSIQLNPVNAQAAFLSVVKLKEGPRYLGEPEELYKWEGEEEKKDAPLVLTDIHYRSDGKGYIHKEYLQIFLKDLAEPKEATIQLTDDKDRIGQIIWSPKGNYLYYTVNIYNLQTGTNQSLVKQITVNGNLQNTVFLFDGQIRQITIADEGRSLLFLGADNSYPSGVSPSRLWYAPLNKSLPLKEEDLLCLNPLEEGMLSNLQYNPTNKQVYYIKAYHGTSNLFMVPYADGLAEDEEIVLKDPLAVVGAAEICPEGGVLFINEDFINPPELYWQKDDEKQQLTHINKDFIAKFPPLPMERFTYKGADQWDVDGFLVLPKDYVKGQPVPAILNIHGGPTGVFMDSYQFPFQLMANHGFAVIFTNPRGSITYGAEFANGCVNDLGGKDFQDIMMGVDYVVEQGVADPNRLFVTGWSYGGFMTSWTITQTNRFKAAVAGAIISNWMTLGLVCDIPQYGEGLIGGPLFDKLDMALERSPITHVRNVTTPTMFLHGSFDVRCPQDQTEQFYYALKRLDKEAIFVRYPEQYHGLTKPTYAADRWQRTLSWFKQHLN